MRQLFLFITLLITSTTLFQAQAPKVMTSSEIHQAIQKLNFLGSALYVAAHPDDENTAMISYLSNHVHAETAYLSLTRGDGGQNLIGTEIGDLLGVLRTQELLAARRIDGGNQFFTRANDFGYSKNPDETFSIWNKEDVMNDAVKVIREFQPDIIITRFDYRTPGRTHGHHTASAVVGYEAFNLAGDKNYDTEQPAWQPNRLFFNTSWWFFGSQENFEKADKTNFFAADVGVFYPDKGLSNSEIAIISRAQHRCQGMGRISSRGERTEYLEWLKGSKPNEKEDMFSGINTSWSRLTGGAPIEEKVTAIEQSFNHENPSASVPKLIEVYNSINALPKSKWKSRKLKECKDIIAACAGIYMSAYTESSYLTPGDSIEWNIELTNQTDIDAEVVEIENNISFQSNPNAALEKNQAVFLSEMQLIPSNIEYSSPYWLLEEGTLGMHKVSDKELIGMPESPDPITFTISIEIGGETIPYHVPIRYRSGDPVKGEAHQPFEILPEVFVGTASENVIFKPNEKKNITIHVRAGKDNVSGNVGFDVPKGWMCDEPMKNFELAKKDEVKEITFSIQAPDSQSSASISFVATTESGKYHQDLYVLDYDHIQRQLILQTNKVELLSLDLGIVSNKVGYIMGAGDKVPESLEAVGYQVDLLENSQINWATLKQYPSIIVGIRAYNTIEEMSYLHGELMNYVENGGTLIVQYNTSHRLKSDEIGPYPIELGRQRVSEEDAPVRITNPEHPLLNNPNDITQQDFDNWVQERGLYFAKEWDDKYETIISSHDTDADELHSAILATKYGSGYFIYTSLSFFRELPAGVPGAYKLFVNMISYGQL